METIGRDLLKPSLDTVGGNELPLSVHAVVSDDDLLNEILVKLPVISLVLFKSVSKRWLSLIKSPTFIKRRSRILNIDPPSGLFILHNWKHGLYRFVPLDIRIQSRLENTFKTEYGSNSGNATVLQSCNGLFLCYVKPGKFCVYNPTVNLFKMLPEPQYFDPKKIYFISMAFDPTKSPHYKVVHVAAVGDLSLDEYKWIQTYSSESGIWSIFRMHSDPFDGLESGIYCNDAIHWLSRDDNGALHYKLDFVNKSVVLTKIQLPATVKRSCKLFESRGCLLLLGMDDPYYPDHLNVYEMEKGDSEWSLKYFVDQWRIGSDGV
ncbi:F-box protein-like protein isoform X1 [Tanacetum coccineum]|uniref:F-box protein-like protein isoform X1 n=1 Tax=Tanacetum coccineum TaxID=301880 RepID=A0ABQ4ZV84_9ASTR